MPSGFEELHCCVVGELRSNMRLEKVAVASKQLVLAVPVSGCCQKQEGFFG